MTTLKIGTGLAIVTAFVVIAGVPGCKSVPNHDGRQLFLVHCANCHGVYGAGDGPLSQDLTVVLQDLRRIRGEDGKFPREAVRRVIDGRGGHSAPDMPNWGEVFEHDTDAKIEALVAWIHTLQVAR